MTNFTPGPSQLYFTVTDHLKKAFKEGIPSLSHRSKQFESIFSFTTEGLRQLLNVPPDFFIVFTGSANEIWERSIQNLVEDKSFHLVNGAFSKRYFEIAQQLNKHPEKIEVPYGQSFENVVVPTSAEMIALTHNETSTGVSLQIPFIHSFKEKNPDILVVVDAVSSLPYPEIDFRKVDSVFFSVQKGFGLPAGLGVWIVNKRCLSKSEQLLAKGISIGSFHTLPLLYNNALKNQTPETPNVLSIYLLGKVVADFLVKDVKTIRSETIYKATLLYKALESHSLIKPFVEKRENRSKTVIVANCGDKTEALTTYLQSKGFYPGDGYGEFKKQHLRFANFPAHSKEEFEGLVDALEQFQG